MLFRSLECNHVNLSSFRYAFRSTEKVALQEIGPRFTLKLRWLKKGLPAVKNLGQPSKPLEFDSFDDEEETAENKDVEMQPEGGDNDDEIFDENDESAPREDTSRQKQTKVVPPTDDEYLWMWKVSLHRSQIQSVAKHFLSLSSRPRGVHSSCSRFVFFLCG